jgi:hypothetical protein
VSSDVALALGSAFVASILTTLGALSVASFQAKRHSEEEERRREHEHHLARLADERSLRDAKRERLRTDYEDVAFAADTIQGATGALAILLRGDTVDARNERLNRTLEEATGNLTRPILRLRLDDGAAPIVSLYHDLRAAWWRYAESELPRVERDHRGYDDLIKTLEEIGSLVTAILDKAKADLDALSKPL